MIRNRMAHFREWIAQQSRGVRIGLLVAGLVGVVLANRGAVAIGDVGQYDPAAVFYILSLPVIILMLASLYTIYAVLRSAVSNLRGGHSAEPEG